MREPASGTQGSFDKKLNQCSGIGEFDDAAPLFADGFINGVELAEMRAMGAVGEIIGWAFDADGRLIEGGANARVASAPIPSCAGALVIAAAMGARKRPGIAAAIRGGLINGLITDELTALALTATQPIDQT